ncbi:P-loop containing nucleoside triphosphate hydrolase protein [Apiospora kogelbergensis]|uniref:P-loop containing nucleoside triphosphate hydrolase protein n=1 Tax=Apiospora kogelbergensis TaxID=1337665 RepID=UPI00312E71D5
MEPIGFALGIASLFTTCVDYFELVQSGRYLGQEYHLLETKFINQRIRLVAWGRACGFTDPNGYDRQIDENKEVRDAIETSLLHLIGLLRDGDKLKRKYGLRDADQAGAEPTPNVSIHSLNTWPLLGQSAMNALAQRLAKVREKTKSTQKQANIWTKARWAIMDKDKFAELVQHLRDLIEDLEGLTEGLHLEHRQRELIRQEVESIREIPVLESIEEARVGRLDPVSDAASLRLWSVRDRFSILSRRGHFSFAQGAASRRRSSSLMGEDPGSDGSNAITYSRTEERSEISDEDWEALSRVHSLSSSPSPDSDSKRITAANFQILHRVNCDFCSPAIYLDVPDYSTECSTSNQWMVLDEYHPLHEPKTLHLCGKRLIRELDTYLGQNRQLRFVVFQEYQCRHELDEQATRVNNTPEAVSNGQSIYLVSEELCAAMRYLAARLPSLKMADFIPQAELQWPFYWFYHSRKILESEILGLQDTIMATLVKELVGFLSDATSEEYQRVDELLSRCAITWNTIKYLFAPDDVVIQKHTDSIQRCQAYRVVDGRWTEAADAAEMTLRVYYVALQAHFVLLQKDLTITMGAFDDPDSEVAIKELPVLPLRYDPQITERALVDRSKKLTGISEDQFNLRYRWVCYSGTEVGSTIWVDNLRSIIDPSLYWQHHGQNNEHNPDSQLQLLSKRQHHNIHKGCPRIPEVLTSRDLPLLQPTVYGFDLQTHEWRHLYVANLREVEWNNNAFDSLILDTKEKELLLGSVQSASSELVTATTTLQKTGQERPENEGSPQMKTLSAGDGRGGSVYLFHGGAGTGKSFATSCISERTRKPLYHMTPFATGVSAEAVQHNMEAALALAQRWDCILVLEDADATAGGGGGGSGNRTAGSYMQHEVPRRAMTMALVKLLGSFGGIVVLESSRVGILDDALFSRVHLAVYFPALDAEGRRRIWHDALAVASRRSDMDGHHEYMGKAAGAAEALPASMVEPYLLSPEAEQKLAIVDLNGREIRNVVAQALRIARFRGEMLHMELVESVLRQAVKLQEYRASLHEKQAPASYEDLRDSNSKALERGRKTWRQESLLPPLQELPRRQ